MFIFAKKKKTLLTPNIQNVQITNNLSFPTHIIIKMFDLYNKIIIITKIVVKSRTFFY